MTTPPISSTFISIDDFLAEPTDDPKPPASKTSTAGLPSPARSDGASTPASSFAPPAQSETINWVGLLMEYAAQKGNTPPAFSDIPQIGGLEPKFVTTVKIDERDEPFWDPNQTFPRKKLAKQFSCQLAMTWLSENGYISPSKVPTQSDISAVASSYELPTAAATRVPELCKELGLTPPAYRMSNTPEAPMMWSGYATFPLNTEVPDKIGAFKNVMGKKQAKEFCAKQVIEFLDEYKRSKEFCYHEEEELEYTMFKANRLAEEGDVGFIGGKEECEYESEDENEDGPGEGRATFSFGSWRAVARLDEIKFRLEGETVASAGVAPTKATRTPVAQAEKRVGGDMEVCLMAKDTVIARAEEADHREDVVAKTEVRLRLWRGR